MELVFWISILTGPPVLFAEIILVISILKLKRSVDSLTKDTEKIVTEFKSGGDRLVQATGALERIAKGLDKADPEGIKVELAKVTQAIADARILLPGVLAQFQSARNSADAGDRRSGS